MSDQAVSFALTCSDRSLAQSRGRSNGVQWPQCSSTLILAPFTLSAIAWAALGGAIGVLIAGHDQSRATQKPEIGALGRRERLAGLGETLRGPAACGSRARRGRAGHWRLRRSKTLRPSRPRPRCRSCHPAGPRGRDPGAADAQRRTVPTIGPNNVRLLTHSGRCAARSRHTSVPREWPTRCVGPPPTFCTTSQIVSTNNSIVSAWKGRGERPEPGRSGRTQRNPPSAPSSIWNEFDVPPRPWTKTIAEPAPSISI